MLRLDRRFRLRRARQPATFARSGFRKQLERLRHQPLLDAGEMHIDDRAHGVGVREADVVEEAAAQESVGLLLLVVRRDHHDRPPPRPDGFAGLKSKNPAAPARGRGGLEEGEVAVTRAAKLRPLAKAPGAQFEISIDGTPRTYRDRKAFAIEAAERLKRKHPNSDIVVRDLQSGEANGAGAHISLSASTCGLPMARALSRRSSGGTLSNPPWYPVQGYPSRIKLGVPKISRTKNPEGQGFAIALLA